MLCREVYNASVRMISEMPDSPHTEDYESRAPYLLGAVIAQLLPIDQLYRRSISDGSKSVSVSVCVDLDATFPLCDRFSTAATYYLAAMLVMEENEALGDRLFALYADEIASIQATLPASLQKIADRYSVLI